MKILIIQQKMIGDVLTSTILCQNIKELFPDATVHYMAHTHTLAVLKNNPFIDRVIDFKPEFRKKKSVFFKLIKTVKKTRYDVVIDVYGKWETNIISFLSGAEKRIGYYKWYTRFFYTHPVKRFKTPKFGLGLALENRLQLLLPLITGTSIHDFKHKPNIYLSDEEKKTAQAFLESHQISDAKPLFMIGILGSGTLKTYPLAYMARLLDSLVLHTQATLLFNYIPSQLEEAHELYNLCAPATKKHIRPDAFTASLREFLAVLHHCDALIGNEGGAVNMAKALDIPTFSIFSPWIEKKEWNLFDSVDNEAVHLADYKPDLYREFSGSSLKKNALKLYLDFNPALFVDKLLSFARRF